MAESGRITSPFTIFTSPFIVRAPQSGSRCGEAVMNGSELPPLCKLTGDGWDSVVDLANASFQACFFLSAEVLSQDQEDEYE